MKLGCVQPGYLPWIPFFKRMQISNVFVYLDDVEFSKNNFHNRNRINSSSGEIMLTVPVLHKGHSHDFICDIKINNGNNWKKKHWKSIEINYRKAKYFDEIAPSLEKIYLQEWGNLGQLNIAIIELFKNFFDINIKTYKSSDFKFTSGGNDKLVDLCKMFKADKFIVKPKTDHYHPCSFFQNHKISFHYFDYKPIEYKQLHSDFIYSLSILDLAMNCGPDGLK